MTNAIRELFELLAKKENTGSDYTGKVTKVDKGIAYVQFDGSNIPDTPVAMSIGAKVGDDVRVHVADGRAWLTGNDTAPPTDDSAVEDVIEDMVDTRQRIEDVAGNYSTLERTAISIQSIVSDGNQLVSIINQTADTVTINASKIDLIGYVQIDNGRLGGFITKLNDTGCASKTSANGGHVFPTSLYAHSSDSTYEYESGLKGDNASATNYAFYVRRMARNGAWSSAVDMFYVRNDGKLYARNAEITGDITASSLTAKNTLYLHNASGTRKVAITAPDASFGSSLSIGTGFDAIYLAKQTTTGGNLMVLEDGTGVVTCGTVNASAVNCSSGNISVGSSTRTTASRVAVTNSYRSGRLAVSDSTDPDTPSLGIFDITNTKWMIRSDANQNVYIPHPLNVTSISTTSIATTSISTGTISTYTDQFKPVGSYATNGYRVSWIGARLSDGKRQFRVHGQFGDTTGTYDTLTCWSDSTSDIRLKDNIRDTDVNGLEAVNKMQLRQFDWKKDGRHSAIGFVADELEEIDPELALGGGYDEDGEMDEKQVSTYKVVAYLTKAVQELSEKVDMLQARVAELEAQCGC